MVSQREQLNFIEVNHFLVWEYVSIWPNISAHAFKNTNWDLYVYEFLISSQSSSAIS